MQVAHDICAEGMDGSLKAYQNSGMEIINLTK
jgi:hypothetical protein